MPYRIIIDPFQKEFDIQHNAKCFALILINSGLYYINADQVRKGKGQQKPTVFVKAQTIERESLSEASDALTAIAAALKEYDLHPTVKLITVSKN